MSSVIVRAMPHMTSTQLYFRLLAYVRPYLWVFALSILGMLISAATEVALPAAVKPFLDGTFVNNANESYREPLATGANLLNVAVPASYQGDPIHARFRSSSQGGLTPHDVSSSATPRWEASCIGPLVGVA